MHGVRVCVHVCVRAYLHIIHVLLCIHVLQLRCFCLYVVDDVVDDVVLSTVFFI